MDWDKASVELAKKLDARHIQPAKQFGPKGDYIEGWHAMAEANRIFGFGGWSYTLIDCKPVMQAERKIGRAQKDGWGVTYVATVRVTVGDVARDDVGAGHGYDVDLGLAHESAIKEAVTDALKRALRGFGNPFGLALYDKSRENVGDNTPPFDPAAAGRRIMDAISKAATEADLTALWKREAETVEQIGGAGKQKLIDTFAARKAAIKEQKEAA